MPAFTVHAFYKFVPLADYRELREPLRNTCAGLNIVGTILLAPEGINATIAGTEQQLEAFWVFMKNDPRFDGIEPKVSGADESPFKRMKVRLKKEIVTMGIAGINPASAVGTYVKPEHWNELINRPDVCLVDTRNAYEVAEGSFRGAVNPNTRSFREFPGFVDSHLDPEKNPTIAMYCTGGIRCEKATSYALQKGFKQVYHLEGGILKYLEVVPKRESLWQGACFVFDERETLHHGLKTKANT